MRGEVRWGGFRCGEQQILTVCAITSAGGAVQKVRVCGTGCIRPSLTL